MEKQKRTDDGFTFAKIGTYTLSKDIVEQFARLDKIQKEANETKFDWVIGGDPLVRQKNREAIQG